MNKINISNNCLKNILYLLKEDLTVFECKNSFSFFVNDVDFGTLLDDSFMRIQSKIENKNLNDPRIANRLFDIKDEIQKLREFLVNLDFSEAQKYYEENYNLDENIKIYNIIIDCINNNIEKIR